MEPMIEHRSRVSVGPVVLGAQKWELPPLILHPFSDQSGPKKLVQSSRASLILNGLLPKDESTEDELTRNLMEGRVCEIRMLFFVGKDLLRWIAQCLDKKQHADFTHPAFHQVPRQHVLR